jgi:hypothetical protein
VVRGFQFSLGNTLDGFRFFQPIASGFRMGERAILRIIGSWWFGGRFLDDWPVENSVLIDQRATPSQHGIANLLIGLIPKRISTPWVAGSNPAGIANDFNEMRVLFLLNPRLIGQ